MRLTDPQRWIYSFVYSFTIASITIFELAVPPKDCSIMVVQAGRTCPKARFSSNKRGAAISEDRDSKGQIVKGPSSRSSC